ncbi:MAG: carbohydrate-binding domain-containing protein [Planctomycetia bacterium]|nr:carbohydrate-binding domain-containing protein [Planctomycetia bacterium]
MAILVLFTFFYSRDVQAGTFTWVGGTDSNFSTPGNWDSTTFGADMDLVFGDMVAAENSGTFNMSSWNGGSVNSLTSSGNITFSNAGGDAVQNYGNITLNGGTVNISSTNNGSSALFQPGGTLNLNAGSLNIMGTNANAWHLGHGTIGTDGTVFNQTGGVLTVSGTARAVRDTQIDISGGTSTFTGALQLQDSAQMNVSGDVNVTVSEGIATFNNSSSLNVSGGTVSFSNSGGDAIVNQATIMVDGGTLNISSSKSGSSAMYQPDNSGGKVVLKSGTLTFTGTNANAWHFGIGTSLTQTGGTLYVDGRASNKGATLNISGGNATFKGSISMSEGATLNISGGTVTFNGYALNINSTSPVSIVGDSKIIKAGSDVMILNTDMSAFTGSIEVQGGHLRVGHNQGLGSAIVILNGGILHNLGDNNPVTNNANIQNEIQIGVNGGSLKAGWSANFKVLGKISDIDDESITAGSLKIDNDSGFVVVANSENDYTGGTIIEGVVRTNTGALGTGRITLDGGTIQNNGEKFNDVQYSATTELSNPITVNSGSIRAGWNAPITLSGKISGTGTLEIANDSGSVILAYQGENGDSNDFTGGIKIGGGKNGYDSGQGTVILGANNALGTGLVSFGSNNSSLDLAGYNVNVKGLEDSNSGISVKNSSTEKVSTLTLGTGTVASDSYTYTGTLADNINLVKVGAGTQIFSSDLAPASISTSGGILQTDGTLKISGTWEETINTTTEFGQLVASNVEFDPIASEVIFSISEDLEFTGDRYSILTGTNGFTVTDYANPSDFNWNSLLSEDLSWAWNLDYVTLQNGGSLVLYVNPNLIPEPATWVLLTFGLAGIFLFRGQNKKNR